MSFQVLALTDDGSQLIEGCWLRMGREWSAYIINFIRGSETEKRARNRQRTVSVRMLRIVRDTV